MAIANGPRRCRVHGASRVDGDVPTRRASPFAAGDSEAGAAVGGGGGVLAPYPVPHVPCRRFGSTLLLSFFPVSLV